MVGVLLAGGHSAHAFEQRTLYFNIPTAGTFPQFTAPSFPPTPTGPSQLTEWASYDGVTSDAMGLPIGTTAGLQVPNLGQIFSTFTVPASLQGDLIAITFDVQFYTTQEFKFTRTSSDGVFTASSVHSLALYDFVSPVPNEDPFFAVGAAILTKTLTLSGSATLSGVGDVQVANDSDSGTGSVSVTTGANYTIAAERNTAAFFTLPVDFQTQTGPFTGGNADRSYLPFGATLIGVTYSFVPESDLAWVGLPLVVGGWLIRRRMVAAKKA